MSRARITNWIAFGFVVAFGLLVFAVRDTPFAVPCFVKVATRLDCPSCGVTRALDHALHRRFGAAFHANPWLWTVVLPALAAGLSQWAIGRPRWTPRGWGRATALFLALTAAFALARNILPWVAGD